MTDRLPVTSYDGVVDLGMEESREFEREEAALVLLSSGLCSLLKVERMKFFNDELDGVPVLELFLVPP